MAAERGRVAAVVRELQRLPGALRDACLPLACAALAALPPGELGERDALQLLVWLQVRRGCGSLRAYVAEAGVGPRLRSAASAAWERVLPRVAHFVVNRMDNQCFVG